MKVKLIGFPYIKFSGKIRFPGDGGDLFVSYGTEDLQTTAFVVEIEGEEGKEVTDDDVIEALEQWSDRVEDVMLARLVGLCDKARAAVTSKQTIGLTKNKPQL